jgi:hypothetical protein
MQKTFILFFSILVCSVVVSAQNFRLSGSVNDAQSGESLPHANLIVVGNVSATQANDYGYYSLILPKGKYRIEVSYVGFRTKTVEVLIEKNTISDINLQPVEQQLQEVNIVSDKDLSLRNTISGKSAISVSDVKNMPMLGGEADIFQSLQYLPGIRSVVEGTTGLSVRGGSFDQTLVSLDEAPVYNASHALGFFSTFNPDAIKSVDIYKGLIPSQFGGRLSSVVDLRMREGNNQNFNVSGGIGLVASRLTIEGPIKKDASSFIFSGRYSYAGLTTNLAGKGAKAINLGGFQAFKDDNDIRFFDLNAKINWQSKSRKDHFFVSAYTGQDWFQYYVFYRGTYTRWNNKTASFRWNHIYNPNLFSNTTLYFSNYTYNYSLLNDRRDFAWKAALTETGLKNEWDIFVSNSITIKTGINAAYTFYRPGSITPNSTSSLTTPFALASKRTGQAAVFAGLNQSVGKRLTTYYGVRLSTFALLGPGTSYQYNQLLTQIVDSTLFSRGKIIRFYSGIEPRLSANYLLDSSKVLTFAYSRSRQYMHLLSNSAVGLPTDVWFPSNNIVRPQSSSLVSMGYKQTFAGYTLSVESYYKKMNNVIDFIDNADLFVNDHVETQVRSGRGTAYGLETLIERKTGKLTGWLAYTLSKTNRQIDGVNRNEAYPTRYDRRHSLSLVTAYHLKKSITISADFQYNSGGAATLPVAVYEFQGSTFNYYNSRNGFRLPAFHRLDLQISFSKKKGKGERQWVFGVYNAYNKRNLFSAEVVPEDYSYFKYTEITAVSLYGVVPSVSYNFKF